MERGCGTNLEPNQRRLRLLWDIDSAEKRFSKVLFMATCYIDRKDAELRVDGRALACYEGGRRAATIPLGAVERLVVIGNVSLETRLLHRLAEQGVTVCFVGGRRHAMMGTFSGPLHNNGWLRLAQYGAVTGADSARAWAAEIVGEKLAGQVGLLEALRPHARRGEVMVEALSRVETSRRRAGRDGVPVATLRGLEGAAAAAYFAAFQECFAPSLGFHERNRRPPRDPVNALLSLTYTLVHFEILREVQVAGLDPTLGFLHEFAYGRESLVCDLVEPQRPAVDRFVWGLFHERVFTARDFSEGEERPGCYLKKAGRSRFYPVYEGWADGQRGGWRASVRGLVRWLQGKEESDGVE